MRWRIVKNIGWANQNIGVQKVVKSDKCMGVSQLLGGAWPGCIPPKSPPMSEVVPERWFQRDGKTANDSNLNLLHSNCNEGYTRQQTLIKIIIYAYKSLCGHLLHICSLQPKCTGNIIYRNFKKINLL